MRRCEIEAGLGVFGIQIPEADGIVEGAGDEFVFTGVHGEGGNRGGVP